MSRLLILFLFWTLASAAQEDNLKAQLFFRDGTSVEGFGYVEKNEIMFSVKQEGPYEGWDDIMVSKAIFFDAYDQFTYEFIKESEKDKHSKLLKVVEDGDITLYIDSKLDVPTFIASQSPIEIKHKWVEPGTIPKGVKVRNTFYQFSLMNPLEIKEEYKKTIIYLRRKGDEFSTKIDWNYKKQFLTYFRDCAALIDKFKYGKFGKDNIDEAVLYYNNYCSE